MGWDMDQARGIDVGRIGAMALAGVALLVAVSAQADGGSLNIVGQYSGGKNDTLKLSTYTEGTTVVGLVTLVTPANARISIAFNRSEFAQFIELMQKAVQIHSDHWQLAGTFSETGTKSPSHAIVYGGAGIQLVVVDPSVAAWSLTVQPQDVQNILVNLNQMVGQLTEE